MQTKFEKELFTIDLGIPEDTKVFLISDTHFGHDNVIRYCNRPFENVNVMNETILRNWCETVTNKDYVIFCGDFVMGVKDKPYISNEIHKILTGKKFMLKGNHDSRQKLDYVLYDRIFFSRYGKRFVCQHHPIDPKEVDCDISIVGHLHNTENPNLSPFEYPRQINVSLELIDYKPMLLTFETINNCKLL